MSGAYYASYVKLVVAGMIWGILRVNSHPISVFYPLASLLSTVICAGKVELSGLASSLVRRGGRHKTLYLVCYYGKVI